MSVGQVPRRAGANQSGVKPPHSKIHIAKSIDVVVQKARDF
jgi:hypothetical protein